MYLEKVEFCEILHSKTQVCGENKVVTNHPKIVEPDYYGMV
jgi:hypothetical protein